MRMLLRDTRRIYKTSESETCRMNRDPNVEIRRRSEKETDHLLVLYLPA